MPQLNYSYPDAIGRPGQVASTRHVERTSKTYRKNKHTQTLTFGGTPTDGTYSAKIDGVLVSVVRTGGSPVDSPALAAQYELNLEANTELDNVIDPTVASAVVTLTAIQPEDRVLITEVTAPAPGTLVLAEVTPFSKAVLPVGIAVVRGTNAGEVAQPVAGKTEFDVVGIVECQESAMKGNTGLEADVDGYEAGSTVAVIDQGEVWVDSETAANEGDDVWVRVVATGLEVAGAIRKGFDGSAELWTMTPTAAELDYLILVEWTNALGVKESIPLLAANPDGTNTATETCDAFRVSFAAAQADGKLTGFTAGGTTTLTLTGPAGVSFEVSSVGEGVTATVETTPAVVDAIRMSRWKFAQTIAAPGRVKIRLAA